MQFSFNPSRVTKELLLNNKSEEEYMTFYLGIIPDKDLHKNPLRSDNKPTASFYRARNGDLIFKDWKTGQHMNFVDVVVEKYGVPYTKALNIIANDFGIIKKEHYEKHEPLAVYDGTTVDEKAVTTIQAEIKEFTDEELAWWLSFGITKETLKKFNVFSIKNVFLNGNFFCSSTPVNPVYGYYFGKEDGVEMWKIYFPLRTSYRFLLNTNKLQGVKQLPKTGKYLVVTKSLKDVMTLYEMGIPAVAPQAESVVINSRQYTALSKRFDNIIFNGDWDGAGQKFMADSRRKYKSICLSFREKSKYAKDVSDLVKKFGFEKSKLFIYKVKNGVELGKWNYQYRYCR